MPAITVVDLGVTDYRSAWDLQRRLFDLRASDQIGDVLLLTEHRPVYTLGTASDTDHLLADVAELERLGAEAVRTDRGGDVTFHGPGQLVGYPILRLSAYYTDIHRYLRDLEETIIRTLSGFGISSHREEGYTGVWVGDEKIAALGVKVSRWVTMHGFAFNVATDLSWFDRIIPCGIFHKGVTSMERILGGEVSLRQVSGELCRNFGSVLNAELTTGTPGQLRELIRQVPEEHSTWHRA